MRCRAHLAIPGIPWHIIQRGNNRSVCFYTEMVHHPWEYTWSSYRTNGEGVAEPLLTPHEEYQRLGLSDDNRRHHYRELFKAHMEPERINEIRNATNGNYALGNDHFKTEIERMLNRRAAPERCGEPAREVRVDG
jgi:putative transposase